MSDVRTLLTRAAGSTLARVLVTVGILAYLASRIDMGDAARAVVSVRPGHLAAVLGLVAVDRAVMVLRWHLLLRAAGTPIGGAESARIFLVSAFVGSFLPAGIGGDAARAYSLAARTAQGSEAVASVVVDRLLGVLSLGTIGALGAVLWSPSVGGVWQSVAAVTLVVGACLAAFWASPLVRALLPARLAHGAALRLPLKVADAVGRYRDRRGVLAAVMAWSIVVQVLRIVQAYLLGLGLGIDVAFGYYLLFMPVGLLMLLLPVSVSGFGLPQGVIVWLLRPVGVADELSFALSTLIVVTGLAGNLPGMLLWLGGRRPPPRITG
ncbi:MAG: lysylphosphatidylglycerol synthase transmembrane domain-containing protein [Acidobacteriota bacterium]